MTKSKIAAKTAAAAIAAITLATAMTATEAEARSRHGAALGIGLVAGTIIGAAIVNSGPVYATPGYRECRYVERYNRRGYLRVVKVCDYGY